jgi:hypothetical protein
MSQALEMPRQVVMTRPSHVEPGYFRAWCDHVRKQDSDVQDVLVRFPPYGFYKTVVDDPVCVNGSLRAPGHEDILLLSVNIYQRDGDVMMGVAMKQEDILEITQTEFYQLDVMKEYKQHAKIKHKPNQVAPPKEP